ncbi:hypothetical protein PV10_05514 [Exophiala mesophila]|uniref:Prokaryotic-type class I peptide chain release factors domain-containing protein n=1 Tax=Exophiala mesophila TaxID=212818 RepID=A0A0D1Z837_EXOME|nr:uncharacterized protein PV10_05514 [Exophiala mesophila]KIV90912.1 hypothetical protein PV10_05514 [Exophiala mesophila]
MHHHQSMLPYSRGIQLSGLLRCVPRRQQFLVDTELRRASYETALIPSPVICCTNKTFSRLTCSRPFSSHAIHQKKSTLPPKPTLPDETLTHVYLKGSGPGGQKINKTNSAVQMTHGPTGIVVKSQATRSRSQNYKIARRILAEKVDQAENGPESRVEMKRLRDSKKKRSAEKKRRRKYRALEEAKEALPDGTSNEPLEDIEGELEHDVEDQGQGEPTLESDTPGKGRPEDPILEDKKT